MATTARLTRTRPRTVTAAITTPTMPRRFLTPTMTRVTPPIINRDGAMGRTVLTTGRITSDMADITRATAAAIMAGVGAIAAIATAIAITRKWPLRSKGEVN